VQQIACVERFCWIQCNKEKVLFYSFHCAELPHAVLASVPSTARGGWVCMLCCQPVPVSTSLALPGQLCFHTVALADRVLG